VQHKRTIIGIGRPAPASAPQPKKEHAIESSSRMRS
jgi:hypothetical protein